MTGKHRARPLTDAAIVHPTCPGCDALPWLVLDFGRQCFCAATDCAVLCWDATETDGPQKVHKPDSDQGADGL